MEENVLRTGSRSLERARAKPQHADVLTVSKQAEATTTNKKEV
jgi:hypothetical protein